MTDKARIQNKPTFKQKNGKKEEQYLNTGNNKSC